MREATVESRPEAAAGVAITAPPAASWTSPRRAYAAAR